MDLKNQSKNVNAFGDVPQDEKNMAIIIWISSIFIGFIGPLIIWLIKKDESSYIKQQGKNYFNFGISYSIYFLVSIALTMVLIGYITLLVLIIAEIVYIIFAIVSCNKGEDYVVPFTIEFIK